MDPANFDPTKYMQAMSGMFQNPQFMQMAEKLGQAIIQVRVGLWCVEDLGCDYMDCVGVTVWAGGWGGATWQAGSLAAAAQPPQAKPGQAPVQASQIPAHACVLCVLCAVMSPHPVCCRITHRVTPTCRS
jgi:hypothetical protein